MAAMARIARPSVPLPRGIISPNETYMLTLDQSIQLYGHSGLQLWNPNFGSRPRVTKRLLFMTRAVLLEVESDEWPPGEEENGLDARARKTNFQSQLVRFVEGATLRVNDEIKLLTPTDPNFADLFAFRSRPPSPQVRMLGYFARPAMFVAVGFEQRDDLEGLGAPGWASAAANAASEWQALRISGSRMAAAPPCVTRQQLGKYLDG